MKRRDFITLLGGATTWPLAARAQQPAMPVIGFLNPASPGPFSRYIATFQDSLKESGYVVGQNLAIEYRWADGRYDRAPALAADLVASKVAVIATFGGEQTALAAKAATASIPIVFLLSIDPVKLGLVASFSHPGGNVTGIVQFTTMLEGKRLGLLHEMVPTATTIAVLINPTRSVGAEVQLAEVREAAARIGVRLSILNATTESEFESAFAARADRPGGTSRPSILAVFRLMTNSTLVS